MQQWGYYTSATYTHMQYVICKFLLLLIAQCYTPNSFWLKQKQKSLILAENYDYNFCLQIWLKTISEMENGIVKIVLLMLAYPSSCYGLQLPKTSTKVDQGPTRKYFLYKYQSWSY